MLTRAACEWAGVPIDANDVAQRCRQLTALFEGAGAVGPRYWLARASRVSAEHWIGKLVQDTRGERSGFMLDTPAYAIALHRDEAGQRLGTHTAAVEILNLLRPIVAVSVYITFLAHALEVEPKAQEAARGGKLEALANEVRRFYPFFPAVMARVKKDFVWRGYQLVANRRVLLDLYGTNRDSRNWREPDRFSPERFDGPTGEFQFVPQGGGSHEVGHRCAGEDATLRLMKGAAEFLLHRLDYEVPGQDLSIDMSRLPALPRSRMVLRNPRAKAAP